jgi:hypothetical protein
MATSVKDELHGLIDTLGDEEATAVLSFVRELHNRAQPSVASSEGALHRRMGSSVISAQEFFIAPRKTIGQIAAEQGIRPIEDIDELADDCWPQDESVEVMAETIRRWRREGGYA